MMDYNNEFGNKYLSSLDNNGLTQKSLLETKLFSNDWIEYITENLQYINNIIKNPRTFIKEEKNIVPVEMARRTTSESVRHLAANSRYIKDINKDGEIIPRKVLSSNLDIDKATYENRFIKSLIDKLIAFLEKRYQTIKALNETDYFTKFHTSSAFTYEDLDIEFAIKLNIYKKTHFEEAEKENEEILIKIDELIRNVQGFIKSPFYQSLQRADAVTSPINRTNIINQDPNYHKCYLLWLYLDSKNNLEYEIIRYLCEEKVDKDTLKDLFMNAFSSLYDDQIDYSQFQKSETIAVEEKKKIIKPEITRPVSKLSMEDYLINEYYFQESRKVYNRRIQERIESGEPFHVAFEDVYRGAFKIMERIFDDLMETPEELKDNPNALLRFKMRNQSALEQIYKAKIADLVKMQKTQIQLIKEIEKAKLDIEKKKLQNNLKKPLITKAEMQLEKERLDKIIETAKNKLQEQREKAIAKLRETKEIEKAKAKLKIQHEREKAKEKLRFEKMKAKNLLEIKREAEKAKYETKIAKQKATLQEKLKELIADIWDKAEAEIAKIRKKTEEEVEKIKKQTMNELQEIEKNPEIFLEGDDE